MRDDPLKNLAIVQAVKDLPQLYERETGIPKNELDRLWKVVGGKVNLSGIAARDRWRIIRGSYVRYLKSMETESAPKKEYYLARYMEFVRPFLKLRESLTRSNCTVYTVEEEEEAEVEGTKRATPLRRPPKRVKREVSYAEENQSLKGDEEGEEEEQPEEIMIEELEEPNVDVIYSGSGAQTYTLRNGQLLDSTAVARSVVTAAPLVHSPVNAQVAAPAPVAAVPVPCAPSEEDRNPDLLFFKSLLPQMTNWTKKQKNKFKVAVLTAMDEVDEN